MPKRGVMLCVIIATHCFAVVAQASGTPKQEQLSEPNAIVDSRDSISEPAVVYIDVRSWAEYQLDGIGAHTHIHYLEIADQIAQHVQAKDQTVYVYCAVGGRAELARQALVADGYTNVKNLGGISTVKHQLEVQNQD